MKRQQTTAEYLHQFLPTGFQLRLGEHMTIPAFAELLFDFMYEVEAERFTEEGIAGKPNSCRVRDYTDRLAQRIRNREYERWEDAEEELRLRAEDDLDRIAAYIEECQEADRPDIPQGSEEDGSL